MDNKISINITRTQIVAYIGVLLCSLIVFCAAGQCPVKDSLIKVIDSQVGITEATGNNDGEVEKYIEATGLDPKAQLPYCVAFIYWCFLEVGIIPDVSAPAWSPSWFTDQYTVYDRTRQNNYIFESCDVFGIRYDRLGRIGHGGFIVGEDKKNYITKEANTDSRLSREGDGVWGKRRPKATIYKISRHILKKHCQKSFNDLREENLLFFTFWILKNNTIGKRKPETTGGKK